MHYFFNLNDTKDCPAFGTLSSSVQSTIQETLTILDQQYGEGRDPYKDLGGYVVLLTSVNDVKAFNQFNTCLDDGTFEYVDLADGYLECLYLAGTDYHIFLILPAPIAPLNVISQMDW